VIDADTQPEARIRAAYHAHDYRGAATLLLEAYREEILGFLRLRLHSRAASEEAYSLFSEDVWIGLHEFAWRCSAKTWAYTLARNAANRYASAAPQRNAKWLDLNAAAAAHKTERHSTLAHARTTSRDRIRALREQLPDDDQILLVLRVDRGLAWRELAIALSGDLELNQESQEREAARLRKQFERIKQELRRLARSEGLLKGHAQTGSES
jgi:RNA polymerase sigma-70 factor (ECF subfamily)